MKSLFEKMGGTYRQEGDYLIPNLSLPDEPEYQIGKYGRMRHSYLKEHRPVLYATLLTNGTLHRHLAEIDRACNERMAIIISDMARQEDVTEAPKAADRLDQIRIFQFCNEIACGSNRILCDSSDIGATKHTINAHICKYRFHLFNRALACVQPINRNLNRNIFALNRNLGCVCRCSIIQIIECNLKRTGIRIEFRLLYPCAVCHTTGRIDSKTVIVNIDVNLATQNQIIPMDQCIDKRLKNASFAVVWHLNTGICGFLPARFHIPLGKTDALIEQNDQAAGEFRTVKCIYHAAAFIKAVPACAEQAGMSDGRIIRKQSAYSEIPCRMEAGVGALHRSGAANQGKDFLVINPSVQYETKWVSERSI